MLGNILKKINIFRKNETIVKFSNIDNINGLEAGLTTKIINLNEYEEYVTILGWAIDGRTFSKAKEVIVCIEGKEFNTDYGISRYDVASYFSNHDLVNTGFRCKIPVSAINNGYNKISLKVISHNNQIVNDFDLGKSYFFNVAARINDYSGYINRSMYDEKLSEESKLSIIIPVYNDGHYLKDALNSISNLNYKNYEVIIINDNSTDQSTLEYLELLRQSDFTILNSTKKGVCAARNTGIMKSTGKYILPLDADNMVYPEYASKGIKFLEENQQYSVFYSYHQRIGLEDSVIEVEDFSINKLITNNCVDTCAIYRRELWEICGGYDENIIGLEDWELWLCAYSYGFKFFLYKEPLFYYRMKSPKESLNLQCHNPNIYPKLISYIYGKHALLIQKILKEATTINLHQHHVQVNDTKDIFSVAKDNKNIRSNSINSGIIKSKKLEDLYDLLKNNSSDNIVQSDFKISVIIVTYNRWTYLRELILSLRNQSYKNFEVIVVNGPSDDETYKIKEQFQEIKYFEIRERNISFARNYGLRNADGEYVIFIDDDALPGDTDWIKRFVDKFKSDLRIVAIAAPVLSGWSDTYEFYRAYGSNYGDLKYIWHSKDTETFDSFPKSKEFPFDTAQGSNMAFRRKELIEIGGFDEYFVYYLDEMDVLCRIYKSGYEIVNLKENYQRHFRGPSVIRGNGLNLKWFRFGRSTTYYGMKNGGSSFFRKLAKVIQTLRNDKLRDIVLNYQFGNINFTLYVNQVIQYFFGGFAGIIDGIFRGRTYIKQYKSEQKSEFVPFLKFEQKLKKYKIAVVAPIGITGETGGAERMYKGLTDALNTETTEADLITVTNDESSFEKIEESYLKCFNLNLMEYDAVISTKAPTYLVRHPKHFCYMIHTIRSYYDMFEEENTISPQMKYQRDIIIRTDTEALKFPNTKWLYSLGYEIKNRLKHYNGLDSKVLHPAIVVDSKECGTYDYIFLPGRLHEWKRVDLVIKAMSYLSEPIRLIISGTGKDEERLKIMSAFDSRIEFYGYVSDEILADLYSNALVIPFVPIREDYGYITLEAFIHEKPVITCSDSGETLQFVINGETGFVVEPEPKEIAKAIKYFFDNPDKAKEMGKRGKLATEHIKWDNISKIILDELFAGDC